MFHADRARTAAENIIDVREQYYNKHKRVIQETNRAIEETGKQTRNGQRECNTRLSQRINAVNHWTSQIDEKLADLNNEIDSLLNYKVSKPNISDHANLLQARVENAIKATIEPLNINENCVNLRENRVDTDVVFDKVEKDLAKEIQTTIACRDLLNATRT